MASTITKKIQKLKTKITATHCACCGRSLFDAQSVECGVGPTCRKNYGWSFLETLPEGTRKKANALVFKIALAQKGPIAVEACRELYDLGCHVLVARIMKRIATVHISYDEDRVRLRTPGNSGAYFALKGIPGWLWHMKDNVHTFPLEYKRDAMVIVKKHFDGHVATGPHGPFIVGEKSKGTVKKKDGEAVPSPVEFTTPMGPLAFLGPSFQPKLSSLYGVPPSLLYGTKFDQIAVDEAKPGSDKTVVFHTKKSVSAFVDNLKMQVAKNALKGLAPHSLVALTQDEGLAALVASGLKVPTHLVGTTAAFVLKENLS